jgi:hypothetical protein
MRGQTAHVEPVEVDGIGNTIAQHDKQLVPTALGVQEPIDASVNFSSSASKTMFCLWKGFHLVSQSTV